MVGTPLEEAEVQTAINEHVIREDATRPYPFDDDPRWLVFTYHAHGYTYVVCYERPSEGQQDAVQIIWVWVWAHNNGKPN